MDPITMLVYFLIALIVLAIVWKAAGALGVPQSLASIILLVFFLLIVLWLVRSAGLL